MGPRRTSQTKQRGERLVVRIIIAGSRTFDDRELLFDTMDRVVRKLDLKKLVVMVRPGRHVFEEWVFRSKVGTLEIYHHESGKEMVGRADALVAFTDGGDDVVELVRLARKAKLKTKVILV